MGKLHPKVSEFKKFVQRHPGIIKEVRSKQKSWQEFFEDWYMFGEDDSMWDKYKSTDVDFIIDTSKDKDKDSGKKNNNPDFMSQIFSIIKNIDMNEVQKHLTNVSNAIANVQQIIEQFQGFKQPNNHPRLPGPGQRPPFFYHKD